MFQRLTKLFLPSIPQSGTELSEIVDVGKDNDGVHVPASKGDASLNVSTEFDQVCSDTEADDDPPPGDQ